MPAAGSTGSSGEIGAWRSATPVTGTTSWPLSVPTQGWTTLTPIAPLVAGRAYRLYGWSDDNGWSASAVTFTLAEVGRLKPGQVLHRSDRSDTAGAAEANEVSTVAEFTSKACARNQP